MNWWTQRKDSLYFITEKITFPCFFSSFIFLISFFPPFLVDKNRSSSLMSCVDNPWVDPFVFSYTNRNNSCWKPIGREWYQSSVKDFFSATSVKKASKLIFNSRADSLRRVTAWLILGLIFLSSGMTLWRSLFRGIEVSSFVSSYQNTILFFWAYSIISFFDTVMSGRKYPKACSSIPTRPVILVPLVIR